ncbi:AAA family ATPase [Alienimonas californiensis]|uniref:ATP-dependent zinc metalloprotease FtsH n=1 Tax=Alienimonas californiensis TaxID=2527989 RepID=A0A517P3V1_9PLAN|nr:ATP-binding protein [Alienimonas californiensis]QDT14057.1 ATP-dependent zinc metalloprotease FtsH [Alienimonas californiensis]
MNSVTLATADDSTWIAAVAIVGAGLAIGLPAVFWEKWNRGWRPFVSGAVRRALGGEAHAMRAVSRSLPKFRLVDLHRAADHVAARVAAERIPGSEPQVLDRQEPFDLATVLSGRTWQNMPSPIVPSPRTARPIGRDADGPIEELLPDDCFWILPAPAPGTGGGRHGPAVLRVRASHEYGKPQAIVEAAADSFDAAAALLDAVEERSVSHSVYRGALLEFQHQGSYDDDGEYRGGGEPELNFKHRTALKAEDIVLDPETLPVLNRNLVEHHRRHADLKRLGLPLSKGLLFHGPPGTGKTYTCRYLVGTLPEVTTFVVAGQSLHQVKSVCGLAKLYEPSLVILEDVDLVFTEREMNPHTSALGDLMDEMDGFRPDEAVSFILTTNALERVERAIKDRPGRIGQCVYFGPPNKELRARYLVQYLKRFDATALDVPQLAEDSRGASQAFLKEWIARAALFALEDESRRTVEPLPLTMTDFEEARSELTRSGERSGAIVGFGGLSAG